MHNYLKEFIERDSVKGFLEQVFPKCQQSAIELKLRQIAPKYMKKDPLVTLYKYLEEFLREKNLDLARLTVESSNVATLTKEQICNIMRSYFCDFGQVKKPAEKGAQIKKKLPELTCFEDILKSEQFIHGADPCIAMDNIIAVFCDTNPSSRWIECSGSFIISDEILNSIKNNQKQFFVRIFCPEIYSTNNFVPFKTTEKDSYGNTQKHYLDALIKASKRFGCFTTLPFTGNVQLDFFSNFKLNEKNLIFSEDVEILNAYNSWKKYDDPSFVIKPTLLSPDFFMHSSKIVNWSMRMPPGNCVQNMQQLTFYTFFYTATELTIEDLVRKIVASPEKSISSESQLKSLLVESDDNSENSEIVETRDAIDINLIDVTTSLRIKTPIRSIHCSHLTQSFDLEEYLAMQLQLRTTWNCHICGKSCKVHEIVIDTFIQRLLKAYPDAIEVKIKLREEIPIQLDNDSEYSESDEEDEDMFNEADLISQKNPQKIDEEIIEKERAKLAAIRSSLHKNTDVINL